MHYLFLSRYLQEIGYTDTIIDVRSSRVRQLLGIQSHGENDKDNRQLVNGEQSGRGPVRDRAGGECSIIPGVININ